MYANLCSRRRCCLLFLVLASVFGILYLSSSPERYPSLRFMSIKKYPAHEPVSIDSEDTEPVSIDSEDDESVSIDSEDKPVIVDSEDDEPVIVDTEDDEPVIVDTEDDEPVIVDTEDDEPVSIDSEDDEPVSIDSEDDEPVIIDTEDDEPVIVDTEDDEPVTIDTEDEPVIVDTEDDEPVIVDTENDEPVIVDTENDIRIHDLQTSTVSTIASAVQMPSTPSKNEATANRSFVYAMSFKDQMTNAIARIRSLQCWARQWNMFTVEPFVNDTFFRTPYHQPLDHILQNRFRKYFDLKTWNEVGTKYNLPVFVDWEDFIANASRGVIIVHLIYKKGPGCLETLFTSPFRMCDSGLKFLRDMWSKLLAKELFWIAREVCIDMTQYSYIDAAKFNRLVFGDQKPPYTVMFNEWRGIATHSERTCYINTIASSCTFKGHYEIAIQSLVPNSYITDKAALYVSKYLSPDFTAIMVRWEKVIQYWGHQNGCLKMIKAYLNTHPPVNSTTVFLTSDVGKFGSQSYFLQDQRHISVAEGVKNHEELLKFVHGRPISVKEYDQAFEEFLGSSDPVFMSRFQQAISARAKCLILVGPDNGLFHRHTVVLHHRLHQNNQCYERFDHNCNKVLREAPWARGTAS